MPGSSSIRRVAACSAGRLVVIAAMVIMKHLSRYLLSCYFECVNLASGGSRCLPWHCLTLLPSVFNLPPTNITIVISS
ncbi:hypothetical protein EDD16DRAFT_1552374 [Pisolithus croceorrhizus]|nr:hypothetical protein EDD16DRAFT_1552374 [Pisolithus croceorrhizus]